MRWRVASLPPERSPCSGDDTMSGLRFWLFLAAAFVLSFLPLIHIPFSWVMTLFHELSHGLAALLTGGRVEKITLNLLGGGLCHTRGGIRFVVLHAGYIGAVLFGILLYEMADTLSRRHTSMIAGALAGLCGLTAVLYGRDILTWVILGVLAAVFVSVMKLQERRLARWALQFMGMYVLLDALRAPLHLLDGRHYGDGAKLADLTGIPELIWVALWLAIGAGGVYWLWRLNAKEHAS